MERIKRLIEVAFQLGNTGGLPGEHITHPVLTMMSEETRRILGMFLLRLLVSRDDNPDENEQRANFVIGVADATGNHPVAEWEAYQFLVAIGREDIWQGDRPPKPNDEL